MRTSLLKEADGFDPKLRVFLDKDFVFRISRVTDFCFVNLPLLEIDRTTHRAEGLIELFQNEAFRLEQLQYLYEKWLELDWLKRRDRSRVREKLGQIHSGWATCHLFNDDYHKALTAISTAVRTHHSFRSLFKYLVIGISPQFARRIVVSRQTRESI
jgi:hypothetical protein